LEITKEYLENQAKEYSKAIEQAKLTGIVNDGALQAIQRIIKDMDKEIKEEE